MYFRVTKSHVEWPYWIFVLVVFCFAHSGDRLSVDAALRRLRGRSVERDPRAYRWPVEAVVAFVAIVYVSAGVAKLFPLRAGVHWLSGHMTQSLVYTFYFDSPVHWLLGRPLFDYRPSLALRWVRCSPNSSRSRSC